MVNYGLEVIYERDCFVHNHSYYVTIIRGGEIMEYNNYSENPVDTWDKRSDVPQYGGTYIQIPINELITESNDARTVAVWSIVEFVGEPPNVHGGGVYRIVHCVGFEHLVGRMFSVGYNRIVNWTP